MKAESDAIADVVNRYAYALDDRDWRRLDEVFAPDVVVRYGSADAPAIEGRVATVAMIRSFLDHRGPSQHLLGNMIVDIDGDTASTTCKARVFHMGAGPHTDKTYECAGVYRDTLTRTAAGWRITERVFDIHFELGRREEVLGAQRSPAPQQSFSFTKILVNDLEAQFSFYSTVFGRTEKTRYDFDDRADPLAEIIMTSADGTDQSLVLLHYKNRPAPAPGSAVIGFEVSGIDAVVQRVADAGGTVTEPPRLMTNIGIKVAFVEDPEGHVLEIFERI